MKTKKSKIILTILSCLLFLLFAGLLAETPGLSKKIIQLTEAPSNLPFSSAILVKDTLYISGQLAVDPKTGKFEGGSMKQQADRVLGNIEILVKKAGMDLSNVVETTVFITDFNEFGEFNEVYRKWFPKEPPTRATVQVSKLSMDAKIEISAVALR
jgi:2-iminobutanoate/2-iminopropanoate deaminase